MNAKRYLLLATAMVAVGARAAVDEPVGINQLPPAVQKTIDASRAGSPVKKIVRRIIDDRPVYLVEIEKNNAPNPHLRIAEDGTLVREPVLPYVSTSDMPIVVPEYSDTGGLAFPRLQLSDLPAAVQQTARREASGRDIAEIDRETWNGRVVYEVEFKERGPNSRIHVAEDGTLVRDERPRLSLKSLFMGTQLEDTPVAVQQTTRRIAGDREIVDIDRKGPVSGDGYYRIEIRDGEGTQQLRVNSDGKVLYDSRSPEKKSRE